MAAVPARALLARARALRPQRFLPAAVVQTVRSLPAAHRHGPCYDPACAACRYWSPLLGQIEERMLDVERRERERQDVLCRES